MAYLDSCHHCQHRLYWVVDLYTWHIFPALKIYVTRRQPHAKSPDSDRSLPLFLSAAVAKLRTAAASLRNNSPTHDPALNVPLKALIPVTTIAVVYCFARAYILLEDLVNLRALPSTAYDTVDWSELLPHILVIRNPVNLTTVAETISPTDWQNIQQRSNSD